MSKNKYCKSCLWETAHNRSIDTSMSNVKWASLLKVSEASIRRHLAHPPRAAKATVATDATETDIDAFLLEHSIPREVVTSRGMSIRDVETGSWQKVSWNPNAKALYDTLGYDDLRESLDGWVPDSQVSKTNTPFSAILMASDLQIGKAQQRGGGTPETIARVRQSFQRFAAYLEETRPRTAVLFDGGDPIENCFNVPSQLVTNDLPVPEQIRVFRRLMLEGIKLLSPLVPELIYGAVPSNHGAAKVGYKSPGGTVDADFGLEISYQLEDAVRENPNLGHVSFVRPAALDETAIIDTADTRLAFNHGHQSSGPNGHGKWWAGQDHGRMTGWDADILVTAHFHSLGLEQSGDGRWIIKSSSSDASSDWFTNRTGESALQGMTAFEVLDTQWSNLRIL